MVNPRKLYQITHFAWFSRLSELASELTHPFELG